VELYRQRLQPARVNMRCVRHQPVRLRGKRLLRTAALVTQKWCVNALYLDGKSIADTTMGNMEGSCAATDSNHVWSLFAPKVYYPQEASNWSKRPSDMRVTAQTCDASLNQGARASNCFSWNCAIGPRGIADCKCPMGQEPPATTFLTEAGQGNPEACYQHPVSLPVATELMELKE
jgi:hypothetical protein